MRSTLGIFINRSLVDSEDVFLARSWAWLTSLPERIQPLRIGRYEPLRKIADVDVHQVIKDDYFASCGRRMLGFVHVPPSAFRGDFYSVNVLLDLKASEEALVREVYSRLPQLGPPAIRYIGQPSHELFVSNYELYAMLNTGLVEHDLPRARELADQFVAFEWSA